MHIKVVIRKNNGFYLIRVNRVVECRVSARELVKHVTTISYEDDRVIDKVFTNKYYLLHVLLELCFLKSMGYRVGEETFKEVELEDLWKAHLKALDIELQYAEKEGDLNWLHRRLSELEELVDKPKIPDEIREEITLFLNKWLRKGIVLRNKNMMPRRELDK